MKTDLTNLKVFWTFCRQDCTKSMAFQLNEELAKITAPAFQPSEELETITAPASTVLKGAYTLISSLIY